MVDLRCINLFDTSPLRRDRGDAAVLHADVGGRLIGLRRQRSRPWLTGRRLCFSQPDDDTRRRARLWPLPQGFRSFVG
jgi:hypothetical protein